MGSLCSRKSDVPSKSEIDIDEASLKCEEKQETKTNSVPPSQNVSRNKAPLLLTGYLHFIAKQYEQLSISVQKIILNYYYIEPKSNLATNLYQLKRDELIDVKDYWGTYLPAKITNFYDLVNDESTTFLKVHFIGFHHAYDEYILYDVDRICDCEDKCVIKSHRIATYQTQHTLQQYTMYGMPTYKHIVGLCPNSHGWLNPIMQILYHTPEFKQLVIEKNANINEENKLYMFEKEEEQEDEQLNNNGYYLVDELLYLFQCMSSGEFQCIAINRILLNICSNCFIHKSWDIPDFIKWIINTLCIELEEIKIKKLFQIQFGNKNSLYLTITKNKINNMVILVNIFNDDTMNNTFDVFYMKCDETINDLKSEITIKYNDLSYLELFVSNNIKYKRKSKRRKKKRQRHRIDEFKMELLDDEIKLKNILKDDILEENVLHLLCIIHNEPDCDLLNEYDEILNEMNNEFYNDIKLNKQIMDTALKHQDMYTVKLENCIYEQIAHYKSMNIDIITFPEILVIFCDYDENKEHLEQKQIEEKTDVNQEDMSTVFDFPLQLNLLVNDFPLQLSLYGIITDEQKCCSCIVKQNDQWYKIRNTDINKLKQEQVTQNQNVCLLFYRKDCV